MVFCGYAASCRIVSKADSGVLHAGSLQMRDRGILALLRFLSSALYLGADLHIPEIERGLLVIFNHSAG